MCLVYDNKFISIYTIVGEQNIVVSFFGFTTGASDNHVTVGHVTF